MNRTLKLKCGGVFALAFSLLLGLIPFAPSALNAQADRSERLQEKVKTSDDRIDLRKSKADAQRINSPAFQAVRKAKKQRALAQQKVAEAEANESRAKNESTKRAAARSEVTRSKRESDRIRTARAQLNAAEVEVKEAEDRLKAQ